MSKYCSDCNNLNVKKSKCDGIYNCKVKKGFVCACNNACEKFSNCYDRNSFEKQRLYDLGKSAMKKDDISTGYIVLLVGLIILAIIGKILGY